MEFFKSKEFKTAIDVLLVIFGCFLMGTGFCVFLEPMEISPSGFTGLAAILSYLLAGAGIIIPVSVIYILSNIILFIFSYKVLGKRFAIFSILGVIAYTLAIQFCKFNIDVGKDPLLSSIFGGIFIGIGLGMVIKGKGSTGGTEMLALLIHKNQPNIKVGSIYMFVNAIVIGLNLIFYTPVIALYSCVTIIISGKIADTVVVGLESVRAFNIVTMKPNEMAKEITKELKCGCTWVDSKGMYSGNNYDMLICVVNRQQILPLKEIISKIDKTAFVYSTSVSEAMGGNFAQIKQRKTKNNPTGKSIQNVVVTKPATVIEKIENDIESEKNEKILQQQENKKTNKIDIE